MTRPSISVINCRLSIRKSNSLRQEGHLSQPFSHSIAPVDDGADSGLRPRPPGTKNPHHLNFMADKFTWIPVYREIAQRLLDWQDRQGDLIAFLEQLRSQGLTITPLSDQDDKGARFLLQEIDPFTFFGVFNRGIRKEQRLAIIAEVVKLLAVQSPLPKDFEGLPHLNAQNSWFISFLPGRKADDVNRLWRVFRLALGDNPLEQAEFLQAFDEALEVKYTNLNLTMGLFWIRPDVFLNLDQTNRQYLKLKLPPNGLSSQYYRDTVQSVRAKVKSLPDLSYDAWFAVKTKPEPLPPDTQISAENNYWMLGAFWSDNEPPDQTQRFLDEGVWENGYKDRYLDEVRSMRVGDKIAIKAASTQRHDLPFDARGETVSRMTIKAIGTVVANRGDGRTIEVEWDPSFGPKEWYFYTYRNTVWQLRQDDQYAKRLIEFAFANKPQDYNWFCEKWWGTSEGKKEIPDEPKASDLARPYSIDDMVASGVFLAESEVKQILDRLQSKKNLILQGPPGVGKNFIARKLAYALIEEMDDRRIEMVQFHQSYLTRLHPRIPPPPRQTRIFRIARRCLLQLLPARESGSRTAHTYLLSMRSTEATLARYSVSY